jgi:hypothetical protein
LEDFRLCPFAVLQYPVVAPPPAPYAVLAIQLEQLKKVYQPAAQFAHARRAIRQTNIVDDDRSNGKLEWSCLHLHIIFIHLLFSYFISTITLQF